MLVVATVRLYYLYCTFLIQKGIKVSSQSEGLVFGWWWSGEGEEGKRSATPQLIILYTGPAHLKEEKFLEQIRIQENELLLWGILIYNSKIPRSYYCSSRDVVNPHAFQIILLSVKMLLLYNIGEVAKKSRKQWTQFTKHDLSSWKSVS